MKLAAASFVSLSFLVGGLSVHGQEQPHQVDLTPSPWIDRLFLESEDCRDPFLHYRHRCIYADLNAPVDDRPSFDTALDRLALFIHRYTDVHLESTLSRRMRLKLEADAGMIYKLEAEVRLSIGIAF